MKTGEEHPKKTCRWCVVAMVMVCDYLSPKDGARITFLRCPACQSSDTA
jgi:hypothetical protein